MMIRLKDDVYNELTRFCAKNQTYSDGVAELLSYLSDVDNAVQIIRYHATPSQIEDIIEELKTKIEEKDWLNGWC